jgi:DNA polymerase elongation subunit (family B)
LYENNIDPMIRFIHMRDLEPAGWVEIPTKTQQEYSTVTTHWSNLSSSSSSRSAPFRVSSFDIECMSSHGDFPTARKDYAKLAMEIAEMYKDNDSEYVIKKAINAGVRYALSLTSTPVPGFSRVYLKKPLPKTIDTKIEYIVDDVYCLLESSGDVKSLLDSYLFTSATDSNVLGDEIIQIGVVTNTYGIVDTTSQCTIFVLGTCDDIDGIDVIPCKTERALLVNFAKYIHDVADPDVVIGYNILGFDFEYVYIRSVELGCETDVMRYLSRSSNMSSKYTENNLSSSAMGDNLLKNIDMPGRVVMDVMKVVQRDHKLDSYKLDNVAAHFVGSRKDDVSPADIFRLQKGSSADRAIIAKYCIQDCDLVLRISNKLSLIANNIGMANVCSVPLTYIFMRGQGVKIFSLVAKQCKVNNFIIPCADVKRQGPDAKDDDDDGYEGAIVLRPDTGIYMEPVVVLDYASLYPSSMISENLSHNTIVLDDAKYGNVPGVQYVTIKYDIYDKANKSIVLAEKVCKFAQGTKGLIPIILEDLLRKRKETRREIEFKVYEDPVTGATLKGPFDAKECVLVDMATRTSVKVTDTTILKDAYDPFHKSVLDGLQNAYKVTANSLYGALGARTNPLYLKEIAACTTATGRSLIMKAKKFVESTFGARVVYGDSVASYTPVLVSMNGIEEYVTICHLCNRSVSTTFADDGKVSYEMPDGSFAWSETGWTPLYRVIRHALSENKKMVRVTTRMGIVDVTDDHSLLLEDGTPVSTATCRLGDKLLHAAHDITSLTTTTSNMTKDEAMILGFYAGCRSLGRSDAFLYSSTQQVALWYYDVCKRSYSSYAFELIVRYTATGEGLYCIECDALFVHFGRYDAGERVPDVIMSSNSYIKRAFLDGFETGNKLSIVKSQLYAATLLSVNNELGTFAEVKYTNDSYTLFTNGITALDGGDGDPHSIVRLEVVPYNGEDVYDLTTENGHFAAGVGTLVVHNTDSIFCVFEGLTLRQSMEMGHRVSKEFQGHLKPPHVLEYDKAFMPMILLSKKRYVGNMYEDSCEKFKEKSMGIVLKRRDNANIAKIIYGGVIDIILNKRDIDGSVGYLKKAVQDLVSGSVPIADLVISKSLRASYKDPDRIAHQVLAKRMGARDPGNKPQASDRIPYVYIINTDKKALQGNRIEHPEYVTKKSLKIDYRFYLEHQIIKPVSQIYALVIDRIDKSKTNYKKMYKDCLKATLGDVEKAEDKVTNEKEKAAAKILFGPALADIDRKQAGLQRITDFFDAAKE